MYYIYAQPFGSPASVLRHRHLRENGVDDIIAAHTLQARVRRQYQSVGNYRLGNGLDVVRCHEVGGEPIVVRQTAKWGRLQYVFRTSPVRGVKANRDYKVEPRVLDPKDEHVIATYSKSFRSDVDQSILPERPPVVGPGYHPAPSQGG
ncbi:MAG: hypothetical protein BMS9Abin10_0535 [Gammaproteobacteria bacterium]|nr:MAG: hypothetical protein BMS9Abin10_0535 [Gammaproteobacteria bacterium]